MSGARGLELIPRLRRLLASRSGKGLTAATLWQLSNYAIPLLTFPYLARVLGISGFGLVGLAYAILSYALMVTDWGFGLTATQAVAQNIDDPERLNRVVWSVILAKAILGLMCGLAIAIGATFAPPALKQALWMTLVSLVTSVLTVDWVLRGAGAVTSFAGISVFSRLIVLPLVFLLVRTPADAAMAVLITGLGSLVTASLCHWRALQLGLLRRPQTSISEAWAALRDGVHVFGSTVAASLYTNTITVGLGVFSGAAQVGLFSAADRIKRPVQSLTSPIGMVFFPRMGTLSASNPAAAERMAKRLLLIQGGGALALTLGLVLFAPLIVRVVLGQGFAAAVPVLQVQAWLIFLVGVSGVLGVMIMLPFGMKKEFGLCIVSGAVVGLLCLYPLTHFYGAVGASWAAVLSEVAVTATMVFALGRRFSWLRIKGLRYV